MQTCNYCCNIYTKPPHTITNFHTQKLKKQQHQRSNSFQNRGRKKQIGFTSLPTQQSNLHHGRPNQHPRRSPMRPTLTIGVRNRARPRSNPTSPPQSHVTTLPFETHRRRKQNQPLESLRGSPHHPTHHHTATHPLITIGQLWTPCHHLRSGFSDGISLLR